MSKSQKKLLFKILIRPFGPSFTKIDLIVTKWSVTDRHTDRHTDEQTGLPRVNTSPEMTEYKNYKSRIAKDSNLRLKDRET